MHYKLTGPVRVLKLWTAHEQPVRGPYDQIRRPCGIFANYGCVNSLMCPQGRRTAPLRVTHGPRTGPVGYEKHWRFPCGARTMPVRASHGVPVESCEWFNQTLSVQMCQAVRGPVGWCDDGNSTEEFYGCFTCSLGLTGKKSSGW